MNEALLFDSLGNIYHLQSCLFFNVLSITVYSITSHNYAHSKEATRKVQELP